MKKTLLALTTALTLPATMTFADGLNVQFYGGAQAGGTFARTNFKVDSHIVVIPAALTDQKIKQDTGDKFFTGGLFAGLRFFFGNFFTGLEVESNWDGLNVKAKAPHEGTGDSWKLELKRRYQVIPSATLGWKMNEKTALYAKFGVGISKFDLTIDRGATHGKTRSSTVVHFVPALGTEYELHQNAALRFEVSGEVAGRHIKGNSYATVNANQTTKARYRSVSVKAGVLFKI